MEYKYTGVLTNNDGCDFDEIKSNNLKHIKKWAKGRNGNYKLQIYWADPVDPYEDSDFILQFKIINDRLIAE
jgi:hypothetical protein